MSESTGGINCPECGMSFDTRDELSRHSRQQHATITESKGDSKENARNPSIEERIQARTEEKGKGETA
jgi:hypothetical protein